MKDKECVSLGSTSIDKGEDDGNDDDDIDLSDICEVVLSLKCKKCEFLCNDKDTLAEHIKVTHLSKKTKTSKNNNGTLQHASSSPANQSEVNGIGTSKESQNGRHGLNEEQSAEEQSRNVTGSVSKPDKNSRTSHGQEFTSFNSDSNPDGVETNADDNAVEESVEDVFLCAECDIVFSSRETCCSHMHKVHGLKQFSADFIQEEIISKPNDDSKSASRKRKAQMPRKFTSESGTVVPKKYRVSKEVFHSCSKCCIKFENVDVMKFHEKCHLAAGFKLEDTGVGPSLAAHFTEPMTPKGFICPVCESSEKEGTSPHVFPKWGTCSWHLWKEHRIDCELYTCTVCKQFKSHLIARVKDHEQLHSAKASYKCKTCSKTFKQMKQLRCHEKYHKDHSTKLAPEVDSRWYTPKECPTCKRILSDSKCLKKHISAVHNKMKPYVCNICGHSSARKQELMLHMRQHTGEKPYKCHMCTFETGDHNCLRKHKLRHSDERPYACSYCDYRCIQSCAFKKHILACHPGQEVVFLCHLCSHKSVNEALFALHQKDHIEGRISSDSNSSKTSTDEDGSTEQSSSINGRLDNASTNSWSGDDDSTLDIIDNGGVTIPATPPPPSPITLSLKDERAVVAPKPSSPNADFRKKVPGTVASIPSTTPALQHQSVFPQISQSTSLSHIVASESPSSPLSNVAILSIPPSNIKTELIEHQYPFRKPAETLPPIILISKDRQNSTEKEKRNVLLDTRTMKSSIGFGQLQIHTSSPNGSFSPQSTVSLMSPRFLTVSPTSNGFSSPLPISSPGGITQQQYSSSSSDDPENSTSEVITNPHQLIQNIQLTPLDLTDIISMNEQSNDDGMLQRLLDMSGV